MAGQKTFFVTTPIYYVNDVPHIGHAYTTVAADCVSRFMRLKGLGVLFATGTDEHGQKVEKAATAAGVTPIEFADRVMVRFAELWKKLDISNDDFIRTTEERHKRSVTKLWEIIQAKGDIYLGEYEDWYCIACENFWTEKQLVNMKCPDCGRDVQKLKEESYFFRLSKYADAILAHIDKNPGFIQPESKKNEIVSFLKEGLRDLSVSRTSFKWGIPVPGNGRHVMYVWFDALSNYLTVTGYPDANNKNFWPADIHIIGKDILRFHAVYWPAFLLSAGLPLPKKIFAHGWWTVEGSKMSKSKGNVVDPNEVISLYGVDPFRYFLLREIPFGVDGDYSTAALVRRFNGELANDLGNLLSRAVAMIDKYRAGIVPKGNAQKDRELDGKVKAHFLTDRLAKTYASQVENLQFYNALNDLWSAIRDMNEFVDKSAPWKEKDEETLSNILFTLAEGLRIIAVYIYPFMPSSAQKMWDALGINRKIEESNFEEETSWSEKAAGCKAVKGPALFPRIQ